MLTSYPSPTAGGALTQLSSSAEHKSVDLSLCDTSLSASPSSASLSAPPPSPVHTSSPVPSSPFVAFSSPLSIRTSLPQGPSPSAAHIPPLLPLYDDEKSCSSSSSSLASAPQSLPPLIHDHADGQAWHDDTEKGFHARDLLAKLQTQQDDKRSSSSSSSPTPAASTSPLDSPRRLFQLNLKEQERQAKQAERDHQLSVEQKKQQAEDDKYSSDQHKLLHLLTSMYRCRECMPTWKDREEQRLGIETNEYSSRRLNEYCCIGSALQSSFPPSLPLDLLPLMQAYLLTQPTRSFLTHPAPPSAGVTQCYILKKNNRFELYMEMRDHTEWQSIRKRMVERGHLQDTAQSILPPTATNSSTPGDKPQQSAAEKDRERSELLERLFRERQAMRQMWKGGKGSMSPVNSGKGSSQSLGLEDRMKESNMKSMLLSHAEQLLMKNEDIFLLAATRKRAWRGNSYTITMEDDGSKTSSGSESSGGREYIGKLKSNFGGTEFVMFDYGVKASKKTGASKRVDKTDSGNGSVTPLSPLASPLVGGAVPALGGVASNVGGGQRYQRESGVIQYDHFFEHTGSPIRIKIMLPNRSFYPLEQSQLSGSILRQYKAESKDSQQAANTSSQPQQSVGGAQPQLVDEEDDEFTPPPTAATQSTTSASASASASTVSSPPPSPSHSPLRPKATEPDEYDYQTVGQHVEVFENLRPVWHDGMNAYVLHFDNHRVREKSVKNFKLVRVNDPEKRTVLQFGRVMDRNVFVMDYAWPLSAAQAFAICLSSIDPKIAV